MKRPVLRWSPTATTLVVFLAGLGLCAARFPVVLSGQVLGDLLTDSAGLGIVAVGMTVVVVSGGIDLSVAGVMAFSAMFVAVAIERWGLPPLAAFALIAALASAFGAAVGAGVHLLKTPPFILTLAAMFLARGACFVLSKEAIPIRQPDFQRLSSFALHLPGGFTLSAVTMLMLTAFVLGGVLLHRTAWGATVFAIGGDPRSAELMGLPVARTTVSIYAFSAFCASVAGVALSLYTGAGYPLAAQGSELDAIAAVVIGGALLSGGHGRMAGSFLGVLIQGLILLYITFDGALSSWWAKISIGALLFAFIALQRAMATWGTKEAMG
jgi:ribose/xylose/arabinose/galactoside ABC-type transport system permease subunit